MNKDEVLKIIKESSEKAKIKTLDFVSLPAVVYVAIFAIGCLAGYNLSIIISGSVDVRCVEGDPTVENPFR